MRADFLPEITKPLRLHNLRNSTTVCWESDDLTMADDNMVAETCFQASRLLCAKSRNYSSIEQLPYSSIISCMASIFHLDPDNRPVVGKSRPDFECRNIRHQWVRNLAHWLAQSHLMVQLQVLDFLQVL